MATSEIGLRQSFAIGPIIVDPSRNILSQALDIVSLEPKIMDVLAYLAARQGQVCSRNEIITAVWNVEFGADESLTRAISVIRKAFKKAGGQSQYIQTISKRGYSLQEPVFETEKPPTETTPPVARPRAADNNTVRPDRVVEKDMQTAVLVKPQTRKSRHPGLVLSAILLPIVLLTTAAVLFRPEPFGSELAVSDYGRSVAVMPFVVMSADDKHQYFSEGLAEELSNELGKITSLRVVGQRLGGAVDYLSMSYEEIGDRLRVSHIVHGSVRKQDDRVRITAQLINTEDNSHAWSSTYDGSLDNVFELQKRVASDIVTELYLLLSLEITEPIELEGLPPAAVGPETQ